MVLARSAMFALNMYLIVGAVLLVCAVFIVIVAVWTAVRVGLWHADRRRAGAREHRRRIGPDGRPYPPATRGLCATCGRVYECVYQLPDGRRLCPECYTATGAAPARDTAGTPAASAPQERKHDGRGTHA